MSHIPTGPGQSFSLPLALPSSSAVASPSSSSTVLDSPYGQPHYHRATLGPSRYGSPLTPAVETERDEKRSALVESLNRSITVVFWYKKNSIAVIATALMAYLKTFDASPLTWLRANTQPLRLHQEIPTFPLFSFSSLSEILEQLHISDRTYIDAYDPRTGTWEQQQIASVRRIESEQRLLYRMRRSLFDALRDEECPGLEGEIKLQAEGESLRANALQINSLRKRSGDSSLSPPVSKHRRSFSVASSSTNVDSPSSSRGSGSLFSTPLPLVSTPTVQSGSFPGTPPRRQSRSLAKTVASPRQAAAAIGNTPPQPSPREIHEPPPLDELPHPSTPQEAGPSPQTASPDPLFTPPDSVASSPAAQPPLPLPIPIPIPLPTTAQGTPIPRKWPNDFFVYEIAAGLRAMDALARAEPALKQDEVFRRAFALPYVKSTFCRHRALWRGASEGVRREFELLGRDPRACWGEFARRAEGREEVLGAAGAGAVGRRLGRRGRGRAGGVGEEGEDGSAQERMMNVIGMPLPMIMAALPGLQGMQGAGSGTVDPRVGMGAGVRSAEEGGAQLQADDEPVMGSLRPPVEGQQMQQRRGA
ncbi:hypothetical protein C2E23DRAFT_903078 [Lenzites betulinus]|nr:hypothetical protein C2E23DRAFT_903078 [Lenzites betulinus]